MPVVKVYGDTLPPGSVGPRQVPANPTSKAASPPIQVDRWARNGKHPNAQLMNLMNEAGNQALLYRSKEVFRGCGRIASAGVISSFGAGDRARWRFAFHTSPYTHALLAIVVMHPQGSGTDQNSYARLDIADGGGSIAASQTFVHGVCPTGSTATAARGWQYLKPVTNYITGVSPDTDYFGTFYDVDYGRIQSATVFELTSATQYLEGYLGQNITAHSPILDVYREKLAVLLYNLWRRGGATIFNWSVDDGTAPITSSTSTAMNIIDTSSTAVSASTPGWTFDMRRKARRSQATGVPCKLWAYGVQNTVAFGHLGQVKLKNSAGATVGTIGGFGTTPSWQSADVVLPASVDKYDLHFQGDATTDFSLYAVSGYEYE